MCKYILKLKGKIDNPWCRNAGPETKKVATPEVVPGFRVVNFRSVVFQNITNANHLKGSDILIGQDKVRLP